MKRVPLPMVLLAGALQAARGLWQEDPENLLEPINRVVGGRFFVDHAAVLDYSAKKLWLKK